MRLDRRLDRRVAPPAQLEKKADGFAGVEGQAWRRAGGVLLLSDTPADPVHRWREGEGVSLRRTEPTHRRVQGNGRDAT